MPISFDRECLFGDWQMVDPVLGQQVHLVNPLLTTKEVEQQSCFCPKIAPVTSTWNACSGKRSTSGAMFSSSSSSSHFAATSTAWEYSKPRCSERSSHASWLVMQADVFPPRYLLQTLRKESSIYYEIDKEHGMVCSQWS